MKNNMMLVPLISVVIIVSAQFFLQSANSNELDNTVKPAEALNEIEISKKISKISSGRIQSIKFILGEDRLEEGFGKYTEKNLKNSHCVYATKSPALISEISNSLKASGILVRKPLEGAGWEPREGIFITFQDKTETKILLDNNPYWKNGFPGSIDESPLVMNSALHQKLYEWISNIDGISRCNYLLARQKNKS